MEIDEIMGRLRSEIIEWSKWSNRIYAWSFVGMGHKTLPNGHQITPLQPKHAFQNRAYALRFVVLTYVFAD
ncbi:hypothetical protein CsSME_00037293 [Camellia sinensis var. sinensis]